MVTLEPNEYKFEQVSDIIASRIYSGQYPPKSKIPGVQAICEEFGVSDSTARRVIRRLKDDGLVTILPSVGTFVAATIPGRR